MKRVVAAISLEMVECHIQISGLKMLKYIYRYKYLSNGKGLRSLLKNRDIKFTHPKDFNDPFDCFPAVVHKDFVDLKTKNPYVYKALGLDLLKGTQRIMALAKMQNRMKANIESGEFLQGLLAEASVLSLAKMPDSVLMWSHYAQYHQGAVVEFKIPINTPRFFNGEYSYADLIPLDVRYEKDRPIVVMDGSTTDRDLILDQLFLTKSEIWQYEQESRVIKNEGGHGVFPFQQELLNSVILGARNETTDEIKKLAQAAGNELGKTIPVFQAEFCKKTYKVKIPKFKFKNDER
ncbi:hypothetical protein ASD91_05225 [Pseudomonas sp. Root68]|uniref:DUF2971 domain-containing protein n=1 Tax=unclassified Pseudomonas TaxID=196821 RepID=UPI0006F457EF|nr:MULTISPECIES: DUF2971 domain-containing protein [unclassified Pseudomonas]KRA95842.1 hypothetical protein ASD91_05225 [Pseudomonas sp. Root68]KRB66426.1 hypothetical protein ASD95_06485 [Pseudomonas sp. Root71]